MALVAFSRIASQPFTPSQNCMACGRDRRDESTAAPPRPTCARRHSSVWEERGRQREHWHSLALLPAKQTREHPWTRPFSLRPLAPRYLRSPASQTHKELERARVRAAPQTINAGTWAATWFAIEAGPTLLRHPEIAAALSDRQPRPGRPQSPALAHLVLVLPARTQALLNVRPECQTASLQTGVWSGKTRAPRRGALSQSAKSEITSSRVLIRMKW